MAEQSVPLMRKIGCMLSRKTRVWEPPSLAHVCSRCVRGGDTDECEKWCIINDLKKVFVEK